MEKRKFEVGKTYRIAYDDHRQLADVWYTGLATYLRPSGEDFGTGEKHHIFRIPDDINECTFPESAIGDVVRW